MELQARVLHYVFRVSNRSKSIKFFRDILGMKVLRHEEFKEGCEASCNGPYSNRWSKTMMGYGNEDTHFVLELTYNYEIKTYKLGNGFLGVTIKSSEIIRRARQNDLPIEQLHGGFVIESPDGYKFSIIDEPQPTDTDPIQKVTLASSDLKRTKKYWQQVLGLKVLSEDARSVTLAYTPTQCALEFRDMGRPVNHEQVYGRIAFSVPKCTLPTIEKKIDDEGYKILTPLIPLQTPGKATVSVIILADPDGHEICFVDEEGFSQLSQFDPKGESDLNKYIAHDKTEKK